MRWNFVRPLEPPEYIGPSLQPKRVRLTTRTDRQPITTLIENCFFSRSSVANDDGPYADCYWAYSQGCGVAVLSWHIICSAGTLFGWPVSTICPTMKNVVGSKIREARYRAGQRITQAQLAARLQSQGINLDRTAVSKIESGRRSVTDVEIVGICKALGIDAAGLFHEE